MSKATRVFLEGIWSSINTTFIFRIIDHNNIPTLHVEDLDDKGIATLYTPAGCTIEEFADVISGCFNESSNFGAEVLKAYSYPKKKSLDSINGIKFEFNNVNILVTRTNASKDYIAKEYYSRIQA